MESASHLINSKILKKARLLAKLTKLIRACLPIDCQQHISVSGIENFQLILISDSPVWASKIRLYSQNMIQMLEENTNIRVSKVRIKQSQPKRVIEKPAPKARHLKSNTAEMIKQTADSISDADLQQALNHLAENRFK
jgi:hypothetical protein